jgi:cytochrome c biogenesis protein CcmG, thiol:disulfide interchange protein DsbE
MIPGPDYPEGVRRSPVPFVVVAAAAVLALLVYGFVTVGESATIDNAVARGERPPAPDRTLPRLGGGEGSVGELRGRPVVLNFWASWCDPCRDEAPALERAQARLEEAGGTVLGVTVDDASADSARFVDEHDISFPSLRDVDGALGRDYGRGGVPETFVIDREGRVAAVHRGMVDDSFFDRALPLVLR